MKRWHVKTQQFLRHDDERVIIQDKIDLMRLAPTLPEAAITRHRKILHAIFK